MKVHCPHCQSPLEILPDIASAEIFCPSCGSGLSGVEQTLVSIRPDKKLVGRFELLEIVGRGYFGEVWRARDTDLRRTVAVKLPRTDDMKGEYKERFLREAKTAAQLKHPNIVSVHEVGYSDNTMFIVSDFIKGMTLGELIVAKRPSPLESAELCKTLANALHYAHEAGVIHRDFKPANVMIDQSGQPFLMDFGLAKQEAGEFTMTATGDILGTPAYMSPEQARGDSHEADRRSDVYSLGVVLYELLTGKRPFKGSTHLLLKAIQMTDPSPPSKLLRGIPRDLETICLKAMSKEPSHRYATALEVAEDLQRFLSGESILGRRASSLERGWRWMRRNPLVSLTSSVAVLAIVGFMGALFAPRSPAPGFVPGPHLQKIRIDTSPPGATVTFFPINKETGEPDLEKSVQPSQATPVELEIEPGDYLVVAIPNDDRFTFHEVYRHVLSPGETPLVNPYPQLQWKMIAEDISELPTISLPTRGVITEMVRFDGQAKYPLTSGPGGSIERTVLIPDFFLDTTEVLVKDVYEFWPDSRKYPPFMLSQMRQQPPAEDHPVGAASWHEAAAFAELIGKRLPTEAEYEFAATAGGTQRFPWGDDADKIVDWPFDAVGLPLWDRLTTHPRIAGLFSNVAEWTSSWPLGGMPPGVNRSDMRTVGGGSATIIAGTPTKEDWSFGPKIRVSAPANSWNKGLGFRCARSARPQVPSTASR